MEIYFFILVMLFVGTAIFVLAGPVYVPKQGVALRHKNFGLQLGLQLGSVKSMLRGLASLRGIRWLAKRSFLNSLYDAAARLLAHRGVVVNRQEACAFAVVCWTACGGISMLIFGFTLGSIVASIVSVVLVSTVRRTARMRKAQQHIQEMPQILRSLSTALSAGKTLFQAFEYIGNDSSNSLAPTFLTAALSLRCGISLSEVLRTLDKTLEVPGSELLGMALEISQRTGGSLSDMLATSSHMLEEREQLVRSLRTKTAQARLSVKIVCSLPLVMLLLLSGLSIDFRQAVCSFPGMLCVGIALMLDGCALLVIRHMMAVIKL